MGQMSKFNRPLVDEYSALWLGARAWPVYRAESARYDSGGPFDGLVAHIE
jgi:hypothetical protein